MKIVAASDSSILITFGDSISTEAHERVMALFEAARRLVGTRLRNIHLAYASVLIDFDPLRLRHSDAQALAARLVKQSERPGAKHRTKPRLVTIPVCYEAPLSPDIVDVARHANFSVDDVIRLHCSPEYVVHFLGFTPGFGYLGGLPEPLHVPRLAAPRRVVTAGSVAIAAGQAAVYPVDSPGGWRVIGRTPLRMFRPARKSPSLLNPGDHVRFEPIDRAAFDALAGRGASGGER